MIYFLYIHLYVNNWQVKLIKCLVEKIVVDISFIQLGGLCTLCFLEEVRLSPPNNALKYETYARVCCLYITLFGFLTWFSVFKVDSLINQNHLFKRNIILIKAWCYYESRILGAHHGLISTYALETLVLYIFHVYKSNFIGPLKVNVIKICSLK